MCHMRNIAMRDYQESVPTGQTHWQTAWRTDARQWSLCAAMLGRWHKNIQTDRGTDRRRTKWSLCAAQCLQATQISYLKYMKRRVESLNWLPQGVFIPLRALSTKMATLACDFPLPSLCFWSDISTKMATLTSDLLYADAVRAYSV